MTEPVLPVPCSLKQNALRCSVRKDEVVFWESQTILAEVLSKRGIPHMLLEGQGKGPQRHILDNAARDIASMCFFNKSFEEIKAMEPRLNG